MKTLFTAFLKIGFVLLVLMTISSVHAQIGIDNDNPNPHSSLDLGATDRGLLPNRLTTNERLNVLTPNLTPAEKGLWVYDTDLNLFFFWNSTEWVSMSSGDVNGSGSEGQVALWGMGNALTGSDNFVWEENNTRLGIGTNGPEATTHINTTAGSSLKITSSSLSEVDQYIFGIERSNNPLSGTDYLQMSVPSGSHTNFNFLNLKYGQQTVLKINGDGHLNASTIGIGTDDVMARLNIFDNNFDALIDARGGGTPSILDYMVNFERTQIPYSNIKILRMKLPEGSPDDAMFMELERGADKLIQIRGNGDLVLNKGAKIIGSFNGLNSTDIELNGGDVKLFGGLMEIHNGGKKLGEFRASISGAYINMYNSSEIRTAYLNGSGGGGGALTLYNSDGTTTAVLTSTSIGGRMTLSNANGNSRAVIEANPSSAGGRITLSNDSNTSTAILEANSSNTGAKLTLKSNDQSSEIILSSNHSGSGKSRITVDEIQLKGGADLAEYFDVLTDDGAEELIEPGTIVSIHPGFPGKLQQTTQAYDRKIAGIVSGANGIDPGMVMSQDNSIASGNHAVALTGRVYVKATDANGTIKPGDFLTSSSKPGYAMKAKNMKKAKGAIIGKAMTGLDSEGYVLVLISMQ
jgi:hypothetical protein